jgi:hypothetical protein
MGGIGMVEWGGTWHMTEWGQDRVGDCPN